MRKTFTALFATALLFSGIFGMPLSVHACSCAAASPEEYFERADAVFVGEVVDIDDSREFITELGTRPHNRVDVWVHERWKGVTDNLVTVATAQDSAACGFEFVQGRRYLIYAQGDEESSAELATGLCSGTVAVEDAGALLAALGESDTRLMNILYEPGGMSQVREGLLSSDGWRIVWFSFLVIVLLPIQWLTRISHAVFQSGSTADLFALAAAYITPLVFSAYWLLKRFQRGGLSAVLALPKNPFLKALFVIASAWLLLAAIVWAILMVRQ